MTDWSKWRWGSSAERLQDRFDIATVVVIPVLCFVLDPGILRDGAWGPALLSPLQSAVYVCAIVSIGSFGLSHLLSTASNVTRALVGMGQLCGSAAACLVTLRILPQVLVLAFTAVALVGLLPVATAFSLFRRGIRDVRRATGRGRVVGAMLGAVLGAVTPIVVGAASWHANPDRRVQLILQDAARDQKIPLRALVSGSAWQHVYVFGGYTTEQRINETLGFRWPSDVAKTQAMNEADLLIVFVSNGQVVHYLRIPIATGFVCVDQSSIWRTKEGKC